MVAAFGLCPLVALATRDRGAEAIARGRAVAGAEQSLGAFPEPVVHGWAAGHPSLLAAAGIAYLVLHVPVLIGTLAWAYLLHPAAFPRLRTAFLTAQTLTVAGWLLIPTAPPRLIGAHGFSDTLSALWGRSAASDATWLQSPFAAMPSGHVVFALLAGGAVVLLARSAVARAAGALYPVGMTAITLVTANHFWIDAAGAASVVAVAALVAVLVHRVLSSPAVLRSRLWPA